MSLADKLRLYLVDKSASWTDDTASWTEDGRVHLAVAVEGPLTAQMLIDAHVRALASRAKLTVAHHGAPTSVALRTATRFGITLLDAAQLPEPAAPSALTSPGSPVLASPPQEPEPAPLETIAPADLRPIRVATATAQAEPAPLPIEPDAPAPAEPIIAHSEPAPAIVHADDAMPWDLSLSAPEPEPIHVEPTDLLAMPWHATADDQHEIIPAGRSARHAPARPTALAHDWGLPWPRPVAPTDALAINDPKLWHNPERIQAVRQDLDRAGAPSFGVAKPQGSNWLKHITEFG